MCKKKFIVDVNKNKLNEIKGRVIILINGKVFIGINVE